MMETSMSVAQSGVQSDKPGTGVPRFLVASAFFQHHESLRAQFNWRTAMSRNRGGVLFTESTERGRCFNAPVSRIFTQEVITSFLSRLRSWARMTIGVNHASSPELQAFSNGCWRLPGQDSTPAVWNYMYALGPRDEVMPRMTLVPASSLSKSSILSISRTTSIELHYNSLLTYQVELCCGIEEVKNGSDDLLSSAVFLTGYLW
jgi:hypothetical protein